MMIANYDASLTFSTITGGVNFTSPFLPLDTFGGFGALGGLGGGGGGGGGNSLIVGGANFTTSTLGGFGGGGGGAIFSIFGGGGGGGGFFFVPLFCAINCTENVQIANTSIILFIL